MFKAQQSGGPNIRQVGIVEIGDDVEIGADGCLDRGTVENTVVNNNCKIDNLVPISHNVLIDEGTALQFWGRLQPTTVGWRPTAVSCGFSSISVGTLVDPQITRAAGFDFILVKDPPWWTAADQAVAGPLVNARLSCLATPGCACCPAVHLPGSETRPHTSACTRPLPDPRQILCVPLSVWAQGLAI